jgi:hypothetical protein
LAVAGRIAIRPYGWAGTSFAGTLGAGKRAFGWGSGALACRQKLQCLWQFSAFSACQAAKPEAIAAAMRKRHGPAAWIARRPCAPKGGTPRNKAGWKPKDSACGKAQLIYTFAYFCRLASIKNPKESFL